MRPKIKITKKVQFWNLIMNIIPVDDKNTKIIQKFHVGEAAQTKKSKIFATMGSMYFRLTLPFDLSWGQIEVWQKFFGLNLSNKVWTMPLYEFWCSPNHYWMRHQLFQGTLVSNAAPCRYTGSSGRARSTRADSTHAQYKNVRVCIVNALKLPAKWVLFSIIHLDSTGAKSRSCGFF